MKRLSDFDFTLPLSLIAQRPLAQRSQSRLMTLSRSNKDIQHHLFSDLPGLLKAGDLLVFNESRVIPARFFGKKRSGGRLEFLIERILSDRKAMAHIKSNRPVREGAELILDHGQSVKVVARIGGLSEIHLHEGCWKSVLEEIGQIPLPPYITRQAEAEDQARYQTVYARHEGSVAAPTAGLHFDTALLEALAQRDISFCFVTLHVGAGTFQPVKVDNIEDHQIHQEWIEVNQEVCEKIQATQARKGRVIAVGTTSVRALETAAASGEVKPYAGPTRLFIYPPYPFRSPIEGLITNFHLPKSSLLMLVAAFAGYEEMMRAYQVAITEQYRFFSYGDGMLIV